jgi:hypothetical protein
MGDVVATQKLKKIPFEFGLCGALFIRFQKNLTGDKVATAAGNGSTAAVKIFHGVASKH